MPRSPRIVLPGFPLHVVQRGHDRRSCFQSPDDFGFYLACLRDAAAESGCEIHAYVLMSNHVHLIVTSRGADGASLMMQAVGRRYVRWFNDLRGRSGSLWEGRFHSSVIDSERYLMECHRYVELNPVRAGIVHDPAEYRWSSFRHHALGADDPIVTDHAEFLRFGPTVPARVAAYAHFVREAVPTGVLEEIRVAVNGNRMLGRPPLRRARGRPRKMGSDPYSENGV